MLTTENTSSLTQNFSFLYSKRSMKRHTLTYWGNSSNLDNNDWKRSPKCHPSWFSPPSLKSWDPCTKETISPLSYPSISRDAERRACSISFQSSPRITMRWKATWKKLPRSSTITFTLKRSISKTSNRMWNKKSFSSLCLSQRPGRESQSSLRKRNMIQ